jgi:hypothetical protein
MPCLPGPGLHLCRQSYFYFGPPESLPTLGACKLESILLAGQSVVPPHNLLDYRTGCDLRFNNHSHLASFLRSHRHNVASSASHFIRRQVRMYRTCEKAAH